MATTLQDNQSGTTTASSPAQVSGVGTLAAGLGFGLIFGFLLQKGGVAKFHVLIGQLLLEDFTVVKVMLSAVVAGMLGIHLMHRLKMVELHIKPTRIASNSIGGLLFGAGFALSAYCPGTGAAALGQGNLDAIPMIAGMIAGSYLFAESSGWISRHIDSIADKGKLTIHELLPFKRVTVVTVTAGLLVLVLLAIEISFVR